MSSAPPLWDPFVNFYEILFYSWFFLEEGYKIIGCRIQGPIKIGLFGKIVPDTVDNFVQLGKLQLQIVYQNYEKKIHEWFNRNPQHSSNSFTIQCSQKVFITRKIQGLVTAQWCRAHYFTIVYFVCIKPMNLLFKT